MKRDIVFFGASDGVGQILQAWPADLPISHFVDNDAAKWGKTVAGHVIKSPCSLAERPGAAFVVVASRWYPDIARQLEDMGLVPYQDFADPKEALVTLRRQRLSNAQAWQSVVMNIEEQWFGVDYDRLRELCAQAGIGYVSGLVGRNSRAGSLTFDAANYRALKLHGVPLYEACQLDICNACGVTPDRIDPADPGHWSIIVEHMQCAAAIVRLAREALDDVRPDLVVIQQGHTTLGAAYRYLAVLRGIRVLALEFSFNNARLVWDDLSGIAVNRTPARNYYWRWADLVDSGDATAHLRSYLSSVKDDKREDHRSPQTQWSGAQTPRRTVLYLANVLTDSSVLFSSRVGTQPEAIKAAARWAMDHDCTFVLKIHPHERPGSPVIRRPTPRAEYSYEGLTVRALQQDRDFWSLVSTSDRCVIDADNRFDTYGLIRRSDVCVTVCSQSGLEALMMGKETVLLGDAYYGGLGFTHDVHDIDQIGAALHKALSPSSRRADPGKVAAFFYIFDQVYCVEKNTDGVADLIRRTLGRARLPVLPAPA